MTGGRSVAGRCRHVWAYEAVSGGVLAGPADYTVRVGGLGECRTQCSDITDFICR